MHRTELHWAWRNLRARGRRAGIAAALLATALAANALLFAVADSVVFHRVPYRDVDRLVEIQRRDPRTGRAGDSLLSPALLDEWRKQTDLFRAVHASLTKNLFLVSHGEPELVPVADITPGLIEMLGARPRWGRSFVDDDSRQLDVQSVLVAESLARRRFGDPASAVGQRLETTGEPLIVVGVMRDDFRFPVGSIRIWRALDPRGPLTRNFAGVFSIARIAPGVSLEMLARMMEQRSDAIGSAAGARAPYVAQPGPLRGTMVLAEQRRLFLLLTGAAICLLLIACANVASLELASAVQRARTYAVQLALGASRASLARTGLIEGAALVGAATIAATLLTWIGVTALVSYLPVRLANASANPIDVDERALFFMAAAAAATWLMSSMPVVLYASRANVVELLKLEGHAVASSRRSGLVRRTLTVVEIALAVLLLVGSLLYVRTYLALLALEKGFDSSGVVTISLSIPPQSYSSVAEKRALAQEAIERLRARPGVVAAADAAPPPSMGANYFTSLLEIDGRPPIEEEIRIAERDVVPDYFSVLRIPIRAGRVFEPGDPPTNVIVSETFAKRYWPGENAVGHQYRRDPKGRWYQIVGVAGHVRTPYDPPGGRSTNQFQVYVPRQPPPPPAPTTRQRETGGSYSFLTLMARVDSRGRASDLYQTVRTIDSRFILELAFVDDEYARQFDDRLLATRVMTGFGLLAFLVAVAGIYSVMAFLVAHRAQEIGIRMALGASARHINRLVVGSSLRLAVAGSALGIGAAIAASRWAESQLFGVRATDPLTIAMVTACVLGTALAATWQPARQATRIDPKMLLRN
jgi:predicted permease